MSKPRRWIEVYAVHTGWHNFPLVYRWRLKSANGRVMATGEAHPTKAKAKRAALEATGHQTDDVREAQA